MPSTANSRTGFSALSYHFRRGFLTWQREITEISQGTPPTTEESAGIISHALGDHSLTRAFVLTADRPEWVGWLDLHGHLGAVFEDGQLGEVDQMLAAWLARRFVFSSPDELFRVFSQHGGKINSKLWNDLVYFLSDDESQVLAHPQVASRWLHFLINSAPIDGDKTNLFKLAEVSHILGSPGHLLGAFGLITRPGPLMHPNPGFTNSALEGYHNRKLQSGILYPTQICN